MNTKPQPWERQPGESARAFGGFTAYRDLGPRRSIPEACRQLFGGESTGKVRSLERWSSTWKWGERAKAWDDEQDRLSRETEVETVKRMRKRHAREALKLQRKALDRLKKLDPDTLTPAQVLDFIIEAAKLERLARGEPESIQEHRAEVNARVDLFDRVQQYAGILRTLGSRFPGVPSGPLPGNGNGQPMAPPPANRPPG